MTRAITLVLGFLSCSTTALAQRVLECQFVSVSPSSFVYGQWSFAADISDGRLSMLLIRPSSGTGPGVGEPYLRNFTAIGRERSVYHDISGRSAEDGPTATFQMATIGANDVVTLDEWRFGGAEEYDRMVLKCPSHT